MTAVFLANYAYINLVDQLSRLPGISNVQVFGAGQYAMRLWVKPDQLAKLGLTVPDIITAIQAQNTVNPAGKIGSEPIAKGQTFTYTVRAQGRLQTPEEFGAIVVRANTDGSFVRVKDIARIELGAQTYDTTNRPRFSASISYRGATPFRPPKPCANSWRKQSSSSRPIWSTSSRSIRRFR